MNKDKGQRRFKKRVGLVLLTTSLLFLAGCVSDRGIDESYVLEEGGSYRGDILSENLPLAREGGSDGEGQDIDPSLGLDSDIKVEAIKNNTGQILNEELNPKVNPDHLEGIYEEEGQRDKLTVLSILKITLESEKFTADLSEIQVAIHKSGGYISSHRVEPADSKSELEIAKLTVRIPKKDVLSFVDWVKGEFTITMEESETVEITDSIINIKSKLASLSKQEEQLERILASTNSVEDVLLIIEKLGEIEEEKKQVITEYMDIKGRLEYSTIEIVVNEVEETFNHLTTIEKVQKAGDDMLNTLSTFTELALVVYVRSLPYILCDILCGYVVYRVYRKHKKTIKNK